MFRPRGGRSEGGSGSPSNWHVHVSFLHTGTLIPGILYQPYQVFVTLVAVLSLVPPSCQCLVVLTSAKHLFVFRPPEGNDASLHGTMAVLRDLGSSPRSWHLMKSISLTQTSQHTYSFSFAHEPGSRTPGQEIVITSTSRWLFVLRSTSEIYLKTGMPMLLFHQGEEGLGAVVAGSQHEAIEWLRALQEVSGT